MPEAGDFQPLPIGTRSGRLVVIGEAPKRGRRAYVLCRCDCGAEREARSYDIRRGHLRSCGCSRTKPALPRFWKNVREKETGCWQWTGQLDIHGYAIFHHRGRNFGGHRWAYLNLVGPIPEGLQLDHLCRNRSCVNPTHLEPVTVRENLVRGIRRNQHFGKTHCKNGHEYTAESTAYTKRGSRVCRECKRLANQAAKERARHRRRQGIPLRGQPGTRKLTAAEVLEIRSRFAAGGVRPHELAKEFGVWQSTIANVLAGRSWR